MSRSDALNRRTFLRNAGMTALAGAVGARTTLVGSAEAGEMGGGALQAPGGRFDFDTIYNRFGTDSVKFDQQIERFGPGSVEVGMGIADMDFRAAPAITQALKKRFEHENWGYLHMPDAVAETILDWNKRRYNVTIKPEEMMITSGVHPGIIATLDVVSPKGSRVLLQTPTYNGFYSDLRYTQTIAEESPLRFANGRFDMDFDDFERRIGPDTYAFILCNPQNPTGNVWSEADLLRIGEICLKRRVLVLADEIHCDFVTKGQKYTPFASLPDKAIVHNSITFKAASKSFGLAAHKVGWFHTTNAELLAKIKVHHRPDLNTLGIIANHAAYTGGGEWLNQCVEYIDGNHDFAVDFIRRNIPAIKAYKPEGTYLLWLDCKGVAEQIGADRMAEEHNRRKAANEPSMNREQVLERWFVEKAKVHLNQGASYGKGSDYHMRMNLATSRKMVEKALTNIANALKPGAVTTQQLK
ncbi:MAG: aminotransferase class I/II-fold pyridoxal phosphate-dependent enzyme [Acidobacteriota bacterium]